MKKKSSFSTPGQRADIGNLQINRMLPNRYADAVGPFVFLDHILPTMQTNVSRAGTGAHPHRGIATLTYILNGTAEHFDSAGHYGVVHSGGVQWMKAGSGIVHDETLNADSRTGSNLIHAFQFWINLPSQIKAEQPAYLSIAHDQVAVKTLPGGGWIKVITGAFEDLHSPIPNYSHQFLYHIHLNGHTNFKINFAEKIEVAAFVPTLSALINNEKFEAGEFVEFDRNAGDIELQNNLDAPCDVLLFGGEPYLEPIVADGPFVMNSALGIADAYRDFSTGKYGKIKYDEKNMH